MGTAVSSMRQLRSVWQKLVVFLSSTKSVLADFTVSGEGSLLYRLSVGECVPTCLRSWADPREGVRATAGPCRVSAGQATWDGSVC